MSIDDPASTDPDTSTKPPGPESPGESSSPEMEAEARGDRVVYDCTAWSGESRRLFASLIEMRGLQVAWQGTEVTVFSADSEVIDELVDEVMATARSSIDPNAPRIVYEVGDWPDALQNEFAEQLTISEVPYDWDVNGNIVVNEADEELVEEVIDLLPSADSFDSVDGLEVQELLNELFMLADRLSSKPSDDTTVQSLLELTGTLRSVSLPFGFEQREWDKLIDAASHAATTEEALSDKTRSRLANEARELVRHYI